MNAELTITRELNGVTHTCKCDVSLDLDSDVFCVAAEDVPERAEEVNWRHGGYDQYETGALAFRKGVIVELDEDEMLEALDRIAVKNHQAEMREAGNDAAEMLREIFRPAGGVA